MGIRIRCDGHPDISRQESADNVSNSITAPTISEQATSIFLQAGTFIIYMTSTNIRA